MLLLHQYEKRYNGRACLQRFGHHQQFQTSMRPSHEDRVSFPGSHQLLARPYLLAREGTTCSGASLPLRRNENAESHQKRRERKDEAATLKARKSTTDCAQGDINLTLILNSHKQTQCSRHNLA